MKKNNSFLKINLSIFLFVFLTIFILINDYICFFTKTGANFVTYLVSFLLLSLISCFLIFKKKVKIEKDKFNKADIIFLVFIIFILSLRVAIPDSAFDTLNYHLYLQENPFFNNTTFNFFPSRWINTFTLPLADRMHYFFRLILGYRLGLILNTLCLIVVFYQLKRILSKFMNNETLISLSALVIIVTEQILTNMITYYVDLLILPIFLEIILIIFDKEKNPLNNYWILLLAGIAISFKISNIYFIILFAILYIIKYRKSINVKTFLIGIPLFIFPFVLYLLIL